MITRHWGIRVHGTPKPKGSLKPTGKLGQRARLVEVVDNKEWRAQVVAMAQQHIAERADQHQPIQVDCTYSLDRPAAHYGSGANSRKVKLSAPVYPATQGPGDEDKLRRLVLDALQEAGVLRNDAQVIGGENWKHYWDPHPGARPLERYDVLDRPGALIRIRPLGNA